MSPARSLLEVCVETPDDARAAERGGADRVELAAALDVDGVTPGPGTLVETLRVVGIPVVVLVRPRAGDFVYSGTELAAASHDVEHARGTGAAGVTLGCLTPERTIEREALARLVERARPLPVTFHRAFDLVRDPLAQLEVLVELGVERVLTAGGPLAAAGNWAVLRRLVDAAAGRIEVMPGGGVRSGNVRVLAERTGARAFHSSARTGGGRTDEREVSALVDALAGARATPPPSPPRSGT